VVIGPLQLPQCALQGMVDRLGCCAVRDIEFVSLAILRRPRSRSKPKVPNRAVEKAFHTHILVRLRLNPWLKMLWGERRG